MSPTAPPISGGTALDQLLSGSPSLVEALPGIERAAHIDSPLLVLGEPGTGRSSLARAVHHSGPRGAQPGIECDPGTVPSTLFESDLFGFRRGAFTGAERDSPGRVARAEGGTLILDHVEDIPLAAQAKMLRLVAERRYTPLAGREQQADVRFIAIGPPDLAARVRRGAFRTDLFYRLDVLSFVVPPLRQRPADVLVLAERLLDDLCQRLGRRPVSISDAAQAWMRDHRWPGNVRQLRNVLERALIAGDGDQINPEAPAGSGATPCSLVELEQQHIRATLAHTRGHQGRAAELLGISRKALWQKRRRYGIP